jgi:hypothetical protein
LTLLLALFVFRVVAQLCQYFWPNDLLPPFSAWQSGLLPYPVLVMSQFVIIAAAIWAIVGVTRATLAPHRNIFTALLIAGWVYFGAMALRLVAGLTLLKGTRFFGATLPAVFHLVLALLLIVLARHLRRTDRS